jgi:uncharacterized protein
MPGFPGPNQNHRMKSIPEIIAEELSVNPRQVQAAVALLDEGATVPFIARYRKEVTGALDDTQLRHLEERLNYLRELEGRRQVVLNSIREQDKLTPALEADILAADTKTRLEDLYLPYKPKRRTKAQIAREAGLEPLASGLLNDPGLDPEAEAAGFIDPDKGVADTKAALDGARQILMENFAEDAELAGRLRDHLWEQGVIRSAVAEGKEREGAKFADYFEFSQPARELPSHRALALLRGRNEGVLTIELLAGDGEGADAVCQGMIARRFGIADRDRPADKWLAETVRWTWRVKLFTRLDLELMTRVREQAEEEAIRVFAANLKDLLLAAPAGRLPIIGLDPGLRTGVKVAVVDAIGKVAFTETIYPHAPKNQWDRSIAVLAALAQKFAVKLISIGNGTASRETDRLARDLIKRHPELGLRSVVVSEAGASVYSASELAAREFPDMDVSLRGAVSIARRLQDPLAELVKIEPKAIGVGQYQHDVNQTRLARTLENVVEDCVNSVGVDLNTASLPLLTQVSGLNATLAENIIRYRDENGAFRNRKELKKVPRLGDKTFQQAAGFLRIPGGDDPLDASAVHPESYPVVERIIRQCGRPIGSLIGDSGFLRQLKPGDFTDEGVGLLTVRDILGELEKPGRDPRPEFKTANLTEGVEDIKDLAPDMILEGTVSNVTNFGAFVDLGVHQDGLVHISAMADHYVKDPRSLVKAGDVVKVKVLEVDVPRRRIALTMRLNDKPEQGPAQRRETAGSTGRPRNPQRGAAKPRSGQAAAAPGGAMADALAKALKSAR